MKTPKLPIKEIIPTGPQVLREGLIVLGGVLIAAWVISRFPKLKAFVSGASITVNDSQSNTYW